MKRAIISEDDECWNIAENMIDEIESIRGTRSIGSSAEAKIDLDVKISFIKRLAIRCFMWRT